MDSNPEFEIIQDLIKEAKYISGEIYNLEETRKSSNGYIFRRTWK